MRRTEKLFQKLKAMKPGDTIQIEGRVVIHTPAFCDECVFKKPEYPFCLWYNTRFSRPCTTVGHPWLAFRYATDVLGED